MGHHNGGPKPGVFKRCIYGAGILDNVQRCHRMREGPFYCKIHIAKIGSQKLHKARIEIILKGKCKSDYRDRGNYQSLYWQRRKESCKVNGLCMRCGKKNPRHGQFFSCGMCESVRRHRKNA